MGGASPTQCHHRSWAWEVDLVATRVWQGAAREWWVLRVPVATQVVTVVPQKPVVRREQAVVEMAH